MTASAAARSSSTRCLSRGDEMDAPPRSKVSILPSAVAATLMETKGRFNLRLHQKLSAVSHQLKICPRKDEGARAILNNCSALVLLVLRAPLWPLCLVAFPFRRPLNLPYQ